jgi:hypothetical protein
MKSPRDASEKLCAHEFPLKDGYFCQLPKGHNGDHESECPNPQFHQSWPTEAIASEAKPEPEEAYSMVPSVEYNALRTCMIEAADRLLKAEAKLRESGIIWEEGKGYVFNGKE